MKRSRVRLRLGEWTSPILQWLLLTLFFLYGSAFDIWGKRFSEISGFHKIALFLIIVLGISEPYLYGKYLSGYEKSLRRLDQRVHTIPNPHVFGNRSDTLKAAFIASLFIDAFMLIVTMYHSYHSDTLNSVNDVLRLVLYSTIPSIGIILMISPTTMFSLRIKDDTIAHCFLARFVLSKHTIHDLADIQLNGKIFRVVLRFNDGKCIRFWAGMRDQEIQRLRQTLVDRIRMPLPRT